MYQREGGRVAGGDAVEMMLMLTLLKAVPTCVDNSLVLTLGQGIPFRGKLMGTPRPKHSGLYFHEIIYKGIFAASGTHHHPWLKESETTAAYQEMREE